MGVNYDLIVLGGGAAGLGAARAGNWDGASVALVSDAPLGGDCTFTGCVPSKSLIEASRQGLTFAEALDRVASVVERIAATENADVMRDSGVDVYEERARIVGGGRIDVDGRELNFKKLIIATGSRAAIPSIPGLEDTPYLTNESFFDDRPQPASLAIIGAGPIGCELGEAMARFGTKVTLVDVGPRVLANYEADASALVLDSLRGRGIDVRLETTVDRVDVVSGQFCLDLGRDVIEADEVLVATGRQPNTGDLGLEAMGVRTDERGFITVDSYLRTNVRSVYAVGDCNGVQMLSHAADEMGRIAAWSAMRLGRRYRYDANRIPHAVFTTPEVASIGVLERDAPANARVAEMPMHANDRALAADDDQGFVRLIAKPGVLTRHAAGGKVVGATIVGSHAGELINEVALVMRSNAYAARLAQTVRAYPSWSTIVQKAAARWFYEYEGEGARSPRR